MRKDYLHFVPHFFKYSALFNKILDNPIFPNFNINKNYFANRDRFFVKKLVNFEKDNTLNRSIIIVGRDHVVLVNKFIPKLIDQLYNYRFINFIFVYQNCKDEIRGDLIIDDDPFYYKQIDAKEQRSVIKFKKSKKQTLPNKYKVKYTTIWTILYNQF